MAGERIKWSGTSNIDPKCYTCGHCGLESGSNLGMTGVVQTMRGSQTAAVYMCSYCSRPTYFPDQLHKEQTPQPIFGRAVTYVPSDANEVYDEARRCMAVGAHTSAVLSCRKLLMNIAVAKGATEGLSFAAYVDFLASKGYVPPDSKEWIDHVRKEGNEATHQIALKNRQDAELLIEFCEMLLRFVFEFPGTIRTRSSPAQ